MPTDVDSMSRSSSREIVLNRQPNRMMKKRDRIPILALGLSLAASAALGQATNLTHRYSFNGDANDSMGNANGTLQGGATITNGALMLNGANSYLALPANLVTGYSAITIEAWVTDSGSSPWARIFDFGNNNADYMFLSLPAGPGNLRGACTTNGAANEQLLQWIGNRPPVGQESQIAWTTDSATHTGILYVNGTPVATNSNMSLTPASLGRTTNNWVGRSQFSNDPYFKGSISELRIYNGALSSNAIYQNYLAQLPPPISAQASIQNNDVLITFNASTGLWYRVLTADSFVPPTWQYLGTGPILATNSSMTYAHSGGALFPWRAYRVQQWSAPPPPRNLAMMATPQTSYVSSWETLDAINDGYDPASSTDHSRGAYGNWPTTGTHWVEYDWPVPINTGAMDVYWWQDNQGIYVPASCSLQYWNGTGFVPVNNPIGLGVALNQYNRTTFTPVTTTSLRLLIQSDGSGHSTGIIEWKVYDSGGSSNFPPIVNAGGDRDVIVGGTTWLNGSVQDDGQIYITPLTTWSQLSGPGAAALTNPSGLKATASFSTPGAAVLQLTAYDGQYTSTNTFNVTVAPPPPVTLNVLVLVYWPS